MENTKKTRGGKRAGAGRKTKNYETKTISFYIRTEFEPEIRKIIKEFLDKKNKPTGNKQKQPLIQQSVGTLATNKNTYEVTVNFLKNIKMSKQKTLDQLEISAYFDLLSSKMQEINKNQEVKSKAKKILELTTELSNLMDEALESVYQHNVISKNTILQELSKKIETITRQTYKNYIK